MNQIYLNNSISIFLENKKNLYTKEEYKNLSDKMSVREIEDFFKNI